MNYDVFNGDADGIFALHQFRLAFPAPENELVTGVKRDIRLLSRLSDQQITSSEITVFDISLDANRGGLEQLLSAGNRIRYFDHHYAGTIPDSSSLHTTIDPDPQLCTALIVNQSLENRFALWAICGAFGDNLHSAAQKLGKTCQLTEEQLDLLKEVGELCNYNGYGIDLDDLHFHPAELYKAIRAYNDPFGFIEESPALRILKEGYKQDMESALQVAPTADAMSSQSRNRVYMLPNRPWARRTSGVLGNLRAREQRDGAHAVINDNGNQTLRISVRAPMNHPQDADTLCRQFPTGGGRSGAAGINSLPSDQLDTFLTTFNQVFSS